MSKAEEEARSIVSSAEEEARRIIEEAHRLKQQEVVKEKERLVKELEANYEAKVAESRLKARMLIAEAKSTVLKNLEDTIRNYLSNLNPIKRGESLQNLMEEAVKVLLEDLGSCSEIIVYVSRTDLDTAKNIAANVSRKLGVRIDVREASISGGVVASSPDGNVIVDNSYEARLRKIITSSLSEIRREVLT